jgi:hypothetical protein
MDAGIVGSGNIGATAFPRLEFSAYLLGENRRRRSLILSKKAQDGYYAAGLSVLVDRL